MLPQPPRVFSIRGLRLYFLSWNPGLCSLFCSPVIPPGLSMSESGALGSASCRTACPSSPTILHISGSCLPQLPVSAPTSLDECFFFYLFGVGLPCHLIFCQFWLCEEARSVSTYASILAGTPELSLWACRYNSSPGVLDVLFGACFSHEDAVPPAFCKPAKLPWPLGSY